MKLNFKNLKEVKEIAIPMGSTTEWEPGTFNTQNGILMLVDASQSKWAIPKFAGLTQILKRAGFNQRYYMPVPTQSEVDKQPGWRELQMEYRSLV